MTIRQNHNPYFMMILKIVSGGQSGADVAALDVALRHGFPHGGWCPQGRRSLDGRIPDRYLLTETPSANYLQRTQWNVRDSDGTVVFTCESEPTGGSLRTIDFARKLGRPCLHLARKSCSYDSPALRLQRFIETFGIRILNVAGSRESKAPGIYQWVSSVIDDAIFWDVTHPHTLAGPGEG